MVALLKIVAATVLFSCFFLLSPAQRPKKKKDLWQSMAEIEASMMITKKPVLIDVYTRWCYYCKVLDATTYRNDSIYNYLKNNFYRYKFDAETKDIVTWQNKQFAYNNLYQVNNFAVYLTRGNLVYPTTVIITPGGQPYYQAGVLQVAEMQMLLKYFGEEHYKNVSIEEFSKGFVPTKF